VQAVSDKHNHSGTLATFEMPFRGNSGLINVGAADGRNCLITPLHVHAGIVGRYQSSGHQVIFAGKGNDIEPVFTSQCSYTEKQRSAGLVHFSLRQPSSRMYQ